MHPHCLVAVGASSSEQSGHRWVPVLLLIIIAIINIKAVCTCTALLLSAPAHQSSRATPGAPTTILKNKNNNNNNNNNNNKHQGCVRPHCLMDLGASSSEQLGHLWVPASRLCAPALPFCCRRQLSCCLAPRGSLQASPPPKLPVSSGEFAGSFHGGSQTCNVSPDRWHGGLSPLGSLQVGSCCLSPRGSLQASPPPRLLVSSGEFASFFHGGSQTCDVFQTGGSGTILVGAKGRPRLCAPALPFCCRRQLLRAVGPPPCAPTTINNNNNKIITSIIAPALPWRCRCQLTRAVGPPPGGPTTINNNSTNKHQGCVHPHCLVS